MQGRKKPAPKRAATHYEILEVTMSATGEEIKKSYKMLALKYHPDKSSDPNAATKMAQLNEAYKVLSNETQRRKYDLLFETGGDVEHMSDESFEFEDEIILEMPDAQLHKRWKNFLLGVILSHAFFSFFLFCFSICFFFFHSLILYFVFRFCCLFYFFPCYSPRLIL
jgi:curved DNA-binding protein CbpA